jgi:Lipase (class 3)
MFIRFFTAMVVFAFMSAELFSASYEIQLGKDAKPLDMALLVNYAYTIGESKDEYKNEEIAQKLSISGLEFVGRITANDYKASELGLTCNFFTDKNTTYGFIAKKPSSHEYVVVLNGTKTWIEWINDASIKSTTFGNSDFRHNGRVESGFYNVYTTMRVETNSTSENIIDTLAKIVQNEQNSTITFTAHSLGSAISVLAIADVMGRKQTDRIYGHLFACPHVGNQEFSYYISSLIKPDRLKIYNYIEDLVPALPPQNSSLQPFIVTLKDTYTELKSTYSYPHKLDDESFIGHLVHYHRISTYIHLFEKIGEQTPPKGENK